MKKFLSPKKHHFVPCCYLKNFLFNGNLYVLNTYKALLGYSTKPKVSQPKKICYLEDYYKIEKGVFNNTLNDYDDLFIEKKVLTALEEKYGQLCQKLIDDTEISITEAIYLADFIIQMKIRNPYWLKTIERKKDEWIEESMNNVLANSEHKNPLFSHIPDELKKDIHEYVRIKNKSDAKFSKSVQLFGLIQRNLQKPETSSKTREAIVNCTWLLLIAPINGPYFITSDNPGFSVAKDGTYNTKFNKEFLFYFPLSPQYCLLITDTKKDSSYSNETTKTILKTHIDHNTINYINGQSHIHINSLLIASDNLYLSQIKITT
jgi:hypothetical protein